MATTFKPTEEQQRAVSLAKTGGSLAIQALAGAGKTSTLRLIAESELDRKRFAYLAFNRKIVEDGKRSFGPNVRCSTAHSMAMGQIGYSWCLDRIGATGRMPNKVMAERLGLDFPLPLGSGEATIELDPAVVAGIVHRTVSAFCQSDAEVIGRRHVPFQRGIDEPGKGYDNNRAVIAAVVPLAQRMWDDLSNRGRMTRFRFTHSHYLKMWQLSGPVIKADTILFDEAQDANPVMMAIVEAQDHAQRIWVGDSNQTIYGWNGAVNAMELADVDAECSLTESFRFGPEIAEQANIVLERLGDARVTGSGPAGSVGWLERPDVFLGRTNVEVVSRALHELEQGRKVCIQGGTREIVEFAEAAADLMGGERTDHQELACFKSWDEVLAYVDTEDGADLRLLCSMITEFGVPRILQGLRSTVDDPGMADVTLSTAHKSKGAEWDGVTLLGDFPIGEDVTPPELRLMYVAATRAMKHLDRTLADFEGDY